MEIRKISAQETLPLRQGVLRPGLPLSESRFARDEDLLAGHFGAFEDDRLIAVGTVYPEACSDGRADLAMRSDGAWRLRGMATAAEWRSHGAGARVLLACLEHARNSAGKLVWCNARVGALEFYLRHGFQKTSDIFELPGIGPHYLMKREL